MKIYENYNSWIIEDQLNKKLVEKINNFICENLNSFLKFKKELSVTGKNIEQYWLTKGDINFYFRSKDYDNIKIEYKSEIVNRLKKSNLLSKQFLNLKNFNINDTNSIWSVVGEENSYHTIHCHHDNYVNGITTVLYLNVPKTNIENEPDNNIFIIMNSDSKNKYCHNKQDIVTINPEIGKIIIFPIWMHHGTYPQSKGIRQTFNIDYLFKNNNMISSLSYQ